MIIPSIDLMDGKAVQLRKGKSKILEETNISKWIRRFSPFGEIALIDLNAAMGTGSNREIILSLLKEIPDARVGGGIRTVEAAADYIWKGANKIIIGTAIFNSDGTINTPFLKNLVEAVGRNRIVLALDVKGHLIQTHGWKFNTGVPLEHVVPRLTPYASEFLITHIDREGTLSGLDPDFIKKISTVCELPVTIAGGVKQISDIHTATAYEMNVQIGMSLYKGTLSVQEAFLASLNFKKSNLLPMIVQDQSGTVLMVGYGNKESLHRTFSEGRVTFFSRSRQRLWTKGETSGNFLRFITIRQDCDGDALLITAEPTGPVCHKNSYSCFGPDHYDLNQLERVLGWRLQNPSPSSYTAQLSESEIYVKILEEAREVVDAESENEIIWEAADVMFFVTLLLVKKGISLKSVYRELERRHFQKTRKSQEVNS